MHTMGGENRFWWDNRIRDMLLDHQSKLGHHAGSWDPKGEKHCQSRIYTTAIGALCLEVDSRYGEALQNFGAAPNAERILVPAP